MNKESETNLEEYLENKHKLSLDAQSGLFDRRTAALPKLLRPFHRPGKGDETAIKTLRRVAITVKWADESSDVFKSYFVDNYVVLEIDDWEKMLDHAQKVFKESRIRRANLGGEENSHE